MTSRSAPTACVSVGTPADNEAMPSSASALPGSLRQVRVWFGQQVVVRYEGNSLEAARYEAAMRRRFSAGRVTNEPAAAPARPLAAQDVP